MEDRNFLAGIAYLGQIIRAKGIENSIDLLKIDTFNLGDIPECCYKMADIMLEDGGKTKPLEVGDVVKYHCTYTEEKHECQGCRYENKEGIIERISLHEKDNGEKYRLYTVKINCCSSCYFTRRELTHIGFAEGVK